MEGAFNGFTFQWLHSFQVEYYGKKLHIQHVEVKESNNSVLKEVCFPQSVKRIEQRNTSMRYILINEDNWKRTNTKPVHKLKLCESTECRTCEEEVSFAKHWSHVGHPRQVIELYKTTLHFGVFNMVRGNFEFSHSFTTLYRLS